ncbi:MAG: hypothetical protein IH841_02370 [Thaumarchaeota archaeon]|nr:hypothetical protein [Nitrososphaerota archaeon]
MSTQSSIPWFNEFIGVAYRYYDLRMNLVPLFHDRKEAVDLWYETIRWWNDSTIKIRFVETGNYYWFIMGAESQRPDRNSSLFKVLKKSENYERFKNGHGGEAYLRLGVYSKKFKKDVNEDAVCNCGHIMEDHDDSEDNDECFYEDCNCKKFESFQVNLLKKKKTVTDIKFLQEDQVKDDPLTWNCLYINKYNKKEQ